MTPDIDEKKTSFCDGFSMRPVFDEKKTSISDRGFDQPVFDPISMGFNSSKTGRIDLLLVGF